MLLMLSPIEFNARKAESLPGPGPLTLTSRYYNPNALAAVPAYSAATCAANGVLFLDPLKPEPPAVAHDKVFPALSVIVTIVLLKVAWICAIPSVIFFFTFFIVFCVVTNMSLLGSHWFSRTLPSPGICFTSLSANRQTSSVPYTSITT